MRNRTAVTLDPRPLDALLETAVSSGAIPGVVALAVDRRGVLYEGAAGRRDLSRPDPMTPDSIFWLASMTKAVTCTAALQLVEAGRLSLDEPIGSVLPRLAAPHVLTGFAEDGAPLTRPATRPVTLRRLMSHTAGFCYDSWNADQGRYVKGASIPPTRSCQLRSLDVPLMREPGTAWEYGIGIDFAGLAVEAASGQRLDRYLADHVLGPLGMVDTHFVQDGERLARRVTTHARGPDGRLEPTDFGMPPEPEFFMGGGGLYGTAADYGRFLRMILNEGELDGERILGPDSIRLMSENQIGALEVVRLASSNRRATEDVEFFPGIRKTWSLGFMINEAETPEGRSAGSLAWAGLANTYFWIDRRRGVAGAVMMQFLPFADRRALDVLAGFERAVYGALAGAEAA